MDRKGPDFGVREAGDGCVQDEQQVMVGGCRCRVKNCGCTAVDIWERQKI